MKNYKKFKIEEIKKSHLESLTGGVNLKRTETHANWSKETARDRDNDVETKADVVSISYEPNF